MDLEKLTPAPWEPMAMGAAKSIGDTVRCYGRGPWIDGDPAKDDDILARLNSDAEFIALARNAFDVMMRRKFAAIRVGDREWSVQIDGASLGSSWAGITGSNWRDMKGQRLVWSDPFTAIVEADKWYREAVENIES